MNDDYPFKLSPTDADCVLARAHVPEHIPNLMVAISGAGAFLIEGYLGYTKDNWIIFVGYPLEGEFDGGNCDAALERIREAYQPEHLWFIGPEIPPSLASSCRTRQSDHYYNLELASFTIKSSLRRQVKRAASKLTVEGSRAFEREHLSLVDELLKRQKLPPMVEELYRSMPKYIAQCETARVLNARDSQGRLTAFFVIETAAREFDTYLLGCYSKKNYVPHASDLLFVEMIDLARQRGVPKINLGLGVNKGIRRFKVKWGGAPVLKYEFCECNYTEPVSIVDLFLEMDL